MGVDGPRSLRAALLALRWDGFLTASEIASGLDHWSVTTIGARLRQLAAEGLIWSIVEAGQAPACKFAHIRTDTADMVIAASPRSLRRGWRPARRIAA